MFSKLSLFVISGAVIVLLFLYFILGVPVFSKSYNWVECPIREFQVDRTWKVNKPLEGKCLYSPSKKYFVSYKEPDDHTYSYNIEPIRIFQIDKNQYIHEYSLWVKYDEQVKMTWLPKNIKWLNDSVLSFDKVYEQEKDDARKVTQQKKKNTHVYKKGNVWVERLSNKEVAALQKTCSKQSPENLTSNCEKFLEQQRISKNLNKVNRSGDVLFTYLDGGGRTEEYENNEVQGDTFSSYEFQRFYPELNASLILSGGWESLGYVLISHTNGKKSYLRSNKLFFSPNKEFFAVMAGSDYSNGPNSIEIYKNQNGNIEKIFEYIPFETGLWEPLSAEWLSNQQLRVTVQNTQETKSSYNLIFKENKNGFWEQVESTEEKYSNILDKLCTQEKNQAELQCKLWFESKRLKKYSSQVHRSSTSLIFKTKVGTIIHSHFSQEQPELFEECINENSLCITKTITAKQNTKNEYTLVNMLDGTDLSVSDFKPLTNNIVGIQETASKNFSLFLLRNNTYHKQTTLPLELVQDFNHIHTQNNNFVVVDSRDKFCQLNNTIHVDILKNKLIAYTNDMCFLPEASLDFDKRYTY